MFVPDSFWGNLSGHRSSKYLVKAFHTSGTKVGVYAPKNNYTIKQASEFKDIITYYEQTEYSFIQNFFPSFIKKEFLSIINSFKPDYIFYMGTIKNKITIDICRKYGLKYFYLPLTTEYYCIKNFAGLEDGPCTRCMTAPILSPFKNKCLGSWINFIQYFKEIFFSIKSKPRILNANKIIGYSNNQFKYLEMFGANPSKMLTMPIFFDPKTIEGIKSKKGDYFVMAGQNITAKGWHIIPYLIKKEQKIRFKLIMKNEHDAKEFITQNNLSEYLKNGFIEILIYLKDHKELLNIIAKSRAVLIPSYYPTTGEFYLLEALGLGKPVIVFDIGIHSEIIKNKINGMISKIGDINGFFDNIIQVNNDDRLWSKLSKNSKLTFYELLSFKKFEESIKRYF